MKAVFRRQLEATNIDDVDEAERGVALERDEVEDLEIEKVERTARRKRLLAELANLPERHREIFAAFLGGISQKDLARRYKLSRSRVSRIIASAKAQLAPAIQAPPADVADLLRARVAAKRRDEARASEQVLAAQLAAADRFSLPELREIEPAMTQAEMARALGSSPDGVSRFERGDRRKRDASGLPDRQLSMLRAFLKAKGLETQVFAWSESTGYLRLDV